MKIFILYIICLDGDLLEQWKDSVVPTWLNDITLYVRFFESQFSNIQLPSLPEINLGE